MDDDDYDITIKEIQICRDKVNDTKCSGFKARSKDNVQTQVTGSW
jgi:hypothetical protein